MKLISRLSVIIFDRPIDIIVSHFENRLTELAMAVIFLGSSILLMFSPASIAVGGLDYLSGTFSLWTVIAIFFVLGVSRIVALGLNGHWLPYGAYVRAAGAAVGAIMWLQVSAALITFSSNGNPLPLETVTYGVLAIFEGISMYRALLGAKKKHAAERLLGMGAGKHPVVAIRPTDELDRVYRGVRDARTVAAQGHPQSSR
jgi:hypothetical protein